MLKTFSRAFCIAQSIPTRLSSALFFLLVTGGSSLGHWTCYSAESAEKTPLDATLRPNFKDESQLEQDSVPAIFREMGVVQRKAMNKSGKILTSNYVGFDFSDGPYSMYSINTNVGYALSDFWEVYLGFAPFFINRKRSIVSKLESLSFANGQQATIKQSLPKYQLGGEILWAPLYGKDSLGLDKIIRSDTFLKFGYLMTYYDGGQSGNKFLLGLGKTFFLGARVGFRVCASGSLAQIILDGSKQYGLGYAFETGVIGYLF